MHIVINDDHTITVEDQYLLYSPYFKTAIETQLGEKSDSLHFEIENEGTLINYIYFLEGTYFSFTEEDAVFFDYMGHHNHLNYPMDYWKLKLRNKWITDNFYKYKLGEIDEGLYGLTEITDVTIPSLYIYGEGGERYYHLSDSYEDGVVIAGGACLEAASYMTSSDVDLFPLDKEKALAFFQQGLMKETLIDTVTRQKNSFTRRGIFAHMGQDISLIRRVYTCPAEVVHGFDLDVCQMVIVYKGGKGRLYATDLARYAVDNGEQWYDPRHVSTTYIQRLAKYQSRGIQLRLPLIARSDLRRCVEIGGISLPVYTISRGTCTYPSSKAMRDELWWRKVPCDIGSILIYVGLLGETRLPVIRGLLHDISVSQHWTSYSHAVIDYDYRKEGDDMKKQQDEYWDIFWNAKWIERDPMSQDVLSNIFYPIDLQDLKTLYHSSPLHKQYVGGEHMIVKQPQSP